MAEIDTLTLAPSTFVNQLSLDSLAVQRDFGLATAEWVAVGLGAHHAVSQREDIFGGAIVGPTTGAETGVIEGDVTRARHADLATVACTAGVRVGAGVGLGLRGRSGRSHYGSGGRGCSSRRRWSLIECSSWLRSFLDDRGGFRWGWSSRGSYWDRGFVRNRKRAWNLRGRLGLGYDGCHCFLWSWCRSWCRSWSRGRSRNFMSMIVGVLSKMGSIGWLHPNGGSALDSGDDDVGDRLDD